MANVFDVAAYILEMQGSMSAMKLQKLVYYSQAWALVWDDEPLFNNVIEAWANGPVVRDLYEKHRGKYQTAASDFVAFQDGNLDKNQKDSIDHVLKAYGDKSAQWLSDQTHSEMPWIEARKGLSDMERGHNEIKISTMAEYYGSL
ncbi:MAG: Panacea domain-containing protein [Pseudomonas sp.]